MDPAIAPPVFHLEHFAGSSEQSAASAVALKEPMQLSPAETVRARNVTFVIGRRIGSPDARKRGKTSFGIVPEFMVAPRMVSGVAAGFTSSAPTLWSKKQKP